LSLLSKRIEKERKKKREKRMKETDNLLKELNKIINFLLWKKIHL